MTDVTERENNDVPAEDARAAEDAQARLEVIEKAEDARAAEDTQAAGGMQAAEDAQAGEDAQAAEDPQADEGAQARLEAIEKAEDAIDRAYSTGRADRGAITRAAMLDATKAVELAGVAMKADEAADEASKLLVIAESMGDKDAIKKARKNVRATRKRAKVDHDAATKSAKKAYDAIKFSDPNKLGFLRVVQVIFALHIVTTLFMLLLTSRDTVVYNSANVSDWISIILEGVAFWFFINRYRIARPFVIGMATLGIVFNIVYDLITGTFDPFFEIWNTLYYIFLLLYFLFSSRVKAVLVNDLSSHSGDFERDEFKINRKGWPFVRNLIIYFIVFSLLGHWMEAGMCQFIILGWVQGEYDPSNTMLWRDWLFPFPMEGAAVVFIALFLYPFKEWLVKKINVPVLPYVISFVANALLCTLIEFTMGLVFNADLQHWNYTNNFCNIMGQVCLQNTLAFGAAASIITWFVYPLMERWLARIPNDIMNIAFVAIAIFGGILWSLYLVEPPEILTEKDASAPATQEDVELLVATGDLITLRMALDTFENDVAPLETIDSSAYEEGVAAIHAGIQQIAEGLGLEKSASTQQEGGSEAAPEVASEPAPEAETLPAAA